MYSQMFEKYAEMFPSMGKLPEFGPLANFQVPAFEPKNLDLARLAEPMTRMGELAAANAEKLTMLQFDNVKASSDLGMRLFDAASRVRDPDTLQAYVQVQQEAAQAVADMVAKEATLITEMGREMQEEMSRVWQSAGEAVVAEAPAAQPAAAPATAPGAAPAAGEAAQA